MPIEANFQSAKYEDGVLTIGTTPPTAIGGWEIQLTVNKRMGGDSNYIVLTTSSGFNGTSGITITNSGNGTYRANFNSVYTSGLEFGNYAYTVERLSSGSRTLLVQGFFTVTPNRG